MKRIFFWLTAAILLPAGAIAAVNVSALFSDGMVLQHGKPVPVWGWAAPGTAVTVAFAGQSQTGKTPDSGRWMVKLSDLEVAKESKEMTITVGGESLVIHDVLVGEVWVCGGQSNMDFTMSGMANPAKDPKYLPQSEFVKNEIQTASDSLFRQIALPHVTSSGKPLDNFTGSWISSNPENNGNFTATGYFFGKELRRELGIPVGLIKCPWGGTRVEPWIPAEAFATLPETKTYFEAEQTALQDQIQKWDPAKVKADYDAAVAKWETAVKAAKAAGKPAPRKPGMASDPRSSNRLPATLYNGMIHPIIPFAMRGAIWYQGESNQSHFPEAYQQRFTLMIESWRKLWQQGDFPFYFAQLAQFQKASDTPIDDNPWVTVCDQQRLTLALKNTGMAVLNDVGIADDIHPRNKMDAGKRLALLALANDYGKNLPASTGPLYRKHRIEGSKIIIEFDQTGTGLMVGSKPILDPAVEVNEPLKRFQICGADKVWKWAEAKIVGKDTVEVSHAEIPAPLAVRYAWAPNAEGANLYNRQGLPASLFRTDN